jgi:hypothetical protein
MRRCAILLVTARETVLVDECKVTTFNVIRFFYPQTEPHETSPLSYGHSVRVYYVAKNEAQGISTAYF